MNIFLSFQVHGCSPYPIFKRKLLWQPLISNNFLLVRLFCSSHFITECESNNWWNFAAPTYSNPFRKILDEVSDEGICYRLSCLTKFLLNLVLSIYWLVARHLSCMEFIVAFDHLKEYLSHSWWLHITNHAPTNSS